jgi:hypothetical protein
MQKRQTLIGWHSVSRWTGNRKDRVVLMAKPAVAAVVLAIGLPSIGMAWAETPQLAQSTITSTPLTPTTPTTTPVPAPAPLPAPTTAPAPLPAPAPVTTTTTTPATSPALSVTELRDCLCMDQQMSNMRGDLSIRQDLLNERQQELANIDQQVKSQATALAPGDAVGHRVLQDLLAQQQAIRNSIQSSLRPAYNNLANQLNAVVARYNGQCVNRPRYAADVNAAQQNLQCPKGY